MEKRYARHNLVLVFGDLEPALEARAALREQGLANYELSVLAAHHEWRPGGRRLRPARIHGMSGVGLGLVAGVLAGGLLGAVVVGVGTLVASSMVELGVSDATLVMIGAVAGATMGTVAGALLGLEAAGRRGAMWMQTLHPLVPRVEGEGVVLFGVHSDDPERVEAAEQHLEDYQPLERHRLDAHDSFHPPARYAANLGRTVPSGSPEAGGEFPGGHREPPSEREGSTGEPEAAGSRA